MILQEVPVRSGPIQEAVPLRFSVRSMRTRRIHQSKFAVLWDRLIRIRPGGPQDGETSQKNGRRNGEGRCTIAEHGPAA